MHDFTDVHPEMTRVTPSALTTAPVARLAIRDQEHACFERAWADPHTGTVICHCRAPRSEAIQRNHQRAGHLADHVYDVSVQT